MLTVPTVPKKKTSSCCISSIPRCILCKKFQDIMKKKEQEKKELKEAKEEHMRKHLENAEEKKRCQEEAKKKWEEKEKTKLEQAKAAAMAALAAPRPKCEQRALKSSMRHDLHILRVVTLMQLYLKIHPRVKLMRQQTLLWGLRHSVQSASLYSRVKRRNQQLAVIHHTVDDGSTGDV